MAGGRGTRGPGAEHDRRRAEIVGAVRRLAAERGIAAVSQSAVAAAAGVSAGRVQHYFPSKDEMLTAVFDELNAAASARIRELVGGDPDAADPFVVLEIVLTELVPHDEATRAHVAFRQAYTALALHHDGVAARLRGRYHHLHDDDLGALVRRGQAAGVLDDAQDPHAVAVRLAALAEGLAYYVLIGITTPETARSTLRADIAALRR